MVRRNEVSTFFLQKKEYSCEKRSNKEERSEREEEFELRGEVFERFKWIGRNELTRSCESGKRIFSNSGSSMI